MSVKGSWSRVKDWRGFQTRLEMIFGKPPRKKKSATEAQRRRGGKKIEDGGWRMERKARRKTNHAAGSAHG
jgi:hypothetical protein